MTSTANRRVGRGGRALGWLVVTMSCGHAQDDRSDGSTGSGSTAGDATDTDGAAPTSDSPSNPSTPATTDGDPSSTGSSSGGDPVVPGCEGAAVNGGYHDCYIDGEFDMTACGWMGTSESVGLPTCITAALVEGGSVCALMGCVDRCDCFAPPGTGTATVECMEGIVAEQTACVLYCGGGEVCPDGMLCSYQTCVWP